MTVELAEIRTERLRLRRVTNEDRETVVGIQTDPRTNRYHPNPPDAERAGAQFDGWLRHWAEHGFGYVAILDAIGDFLGLGGVRYQEFGGEKVLNLYYRFLPEAWGKGYATEMAIAVIGWAERELPQHPVQISVAVVNEPSTRVAERLGFAVHTETFYDGGLSRHFRRPSAAA